MSVSLQQIGKCEKNIKGFKDPFLLQKKENRQKWFDPISVVVSRIIARIEICKCEFTEIILALQNTKEGAGQRNLVFATSSDFLIPISLQSNVANLRYFKLWIIFD